MQITYKSPADLKPRASNPRTHDAKQIRQYLLKNRIYLGDSTQRAQLPGEHEAIVDVAIFEAVQARWSRNLDNYRVARIASNAPLLGKIFDDCGNKMTPTYSYKAKLRYRYYVSRASAEGRANEAGSVRRVPASKVEAK